MTSGRVEGPRTAARPLSSVLADLVDIASRLLTQQTTLGDAVPRLAALLADVPAVRSVDPARASAPSGLPASGGAGPSWRQVSDPDGRGVLLVDVAADADPADVALAHSVLTMLDRACASAAVLPQPRSGMPAAAYGVLVATVDAAGTLTASADTVRQVLGHQDGPYGREQFLGLVHPDDADQLTHAMAAVSRTPRGQLGVDARVRHADDRWLLMDFTLLNLLDVAAVRSVVVCGRDVTEQRAAERQVQTERSRLSEIVLQLTGGVVIDDGQSVIMSNGSFDRTFSVSDSWCGLGVVQFTERIAHACKDPGTSEVLLRRLVESGGTHRGIRLLLDDGRTVACDVVPLTRHRNRQLGTLWQFRDVTAEAAARSELEEHNKALTEATALKGRFVATVSHELRTPLTSILAFGELLIEARRSLSIEQASYIDVINRNTSRLLRLVDDLLFLSRLETNQLPMAYTDVDVPALIAQVEQDNAATAARRGITLRSALGPGRPLRADPARLAQVLDNVVGNALKFTPPGGNVQVSATANDAGWLISVADTGIGIPDDELPGLFETFTRASNAAAAGIPGSGLGLTICRQIVEVHGGSIRVESVNTAGTTVEIALPYHEKPTGAAQ